MNVQTTLLHLLAEGVDAYNSNQPDALAQVLDELAEVEQTAPRSVSSSRSFNVFLVKVVVRTGHRLRKRKRTWWASAATLVGGVTIAGSTLTAKLLEAVGWPGLGTFVAVASIVALGAQTLVLLNALRTTEGWPAVSESSKKLAASPHWTTNMKKLLVFKPIELSKLLREPEETGPMRLN